MNGKFFGRSVDEMEEEFRRLRNSVTEEYERELERVKAEWRIRLEEGRGKSEETRRTLAESGVDVDRLDEMEEAEQKELDVFLSRVKPELIEREPRLDASLKERTVRSTFLGHFGWTQANLIGADLLVPDREDLAGVEGEVGNPGVWLYDASKVKDLKAIATGSGWGCWAYGHVPYAHKAIWWYSWVPPESGKYWVQSWIDYHGFYVLKANDKWYNCKKAEVHAFTDIDIHQYFWRGRRELRVIDKGDDNISTASVLTGRKKWSYTEYLGAGDVVWVRVGFLLDVDARGSGSYAELNFATGKANYIEAPIVGFSKA